MHVRECLTRLAYKYRILNEQLVAGFTLFLIATIGMATVTPDSGKLVILWAVLAGIGFASPISVLFSVTQLSVDPALIGQATGLVVSMRSFGGSIGPSIAVRAPYVLLTPSTGLNFWYTDRGLYSHSRFK